MLSLTTGQHEYFVRSYSFYPSLFQKVRNLRKANVLKYFSSGQWTKNKHYFILKKILKNKQYEILIAQRLQEINLVAMSYCLVPKQYVKSYSVS